ncbi:MAG: glutamate synthase [Thermoproteota archaeon]
MNDFDRIAEGGCGVIGVASSIPIKGRFLLRPLIQMHNRGNGKGGGIAAVGLSAEQLGVSKRVLEDCYLLQVAYLDPGVRKELESEFIEPFTRVEYSEKLPTLDDYRSIGLEVKPPEVWRYFVRVDEDVLKRFAEERSMQMLNPRYVENEFIYRNSFALNKKHYSSTGLKKAFVLSHGRNMIVLKIVGYAEQVIKYYMLEDLEAHIWIGHQRYPTKGKIWHPGGSHPFIGLNDVLVHNGDFANYFSIAEYLRQRDIYPLFLTDTEVAALYWDFLTRIYRYPLEYAIEAIAPTTERDFTMLPEEKKRIYRAIQATHIHGSPDGPWFFIIARNDVEKRVFQLIGITDTSMLRPQVFSLQEGDVKIGIIASERQAIDAMLEELSEHDGRFRPMADFYWYARGGSYTNGGAFIYTVDEHENLICTDKFGRRMTVEASVTSKEFNCGGLESTDAYTREQVAEETFSSLSPIELFKLVSDNIKAWSIREVVSFVEALEEYGVKSDEEIAKAIDVLTLLIDMRYPSKAGRSRLIPVFEKAVCSILNRVPPIGATSQSMFRRVDWSSRRRLIEPPGAGGALVIDAYDFPPEGDEGVCRLLEEAYKLGWRRFVAYNFRGQRNFGAGFIARDRVRIDVYGRVGDCLAAFADGPEFYVHGSVQDSVAYCFRSGKLVVYGDVGKAFEYGAKGGVTFILGDLMDRPLINAVGSATAVINGSCMDYMGESFMAAKGFIILNGVGFDEQGRIVEKETSYHGGNLLPLAAAGAVYVRDPRETVGEDQLNGGKIESITSEDWNRILPLLKENERLFGIRVEDLLRVDGVVKMPVEVYRKVVPVQVAALSRYETGD